MTVAPPVAPLLAPRRLERASANAFRHFLEAAATLRLATPNAWREVGEGIAGFFGRGGPNSLVRGAAIGIDVSDTDLNATRAFYRERGDSFRIELTESRTPSVAAWLALEGARSIRMSDVHAAALQTLAPLTAPAPRRAIEVREIGPDDTLRFCEIVGRAFNEGVLPDPETFAVHLDIGRTQDQTTNAARYLATLDGEPVGAGRIAWADIEPAFGGGRVALLQAGSTLPHARGAGVQTALIAARIDRARREGCDTVVIVCTAGTPSQRNVVRAGLPFAYRIERLDVA